MLPATDVVVFVMALNHKDPFFHAVDEVEVFFVLRAEAGLNVEGEGDETLDDEDNRELKGHGPK